MQSPAARDRRRWLRIIVVSVAGSALAIILVSRVVQSQMKLSEIFVPHQHATAHVHDHGNQTWPPQSPGNKGVVDFSDPGIEQVRRLKLKQRFAEIEKRAAARADFQHAVGRKFSRISIVDEEDKTGNARNSRFTYFSYDTNATVEVLFDGTSVRSVNTRAASEYQPEITDEEIAAATELARTHFLSLGRTRVQELKGYGILAYRPEGKGFYESRVIYISFHANDDAPPEFVAWVDLTNQTIVKAREEH
jgi:hypothetical protein